MNFFFSNPGNQIRTRGSILAETHDMDLSRCGQDFVCDKCGHSYQSKSALNYHRTWICFSEKNFQCMYCMYSGKRFYCFKKHMQRKHPTITRPL